MTADSYAASRALVTLPRWRYERRMMLATGLVVRFIDRGAQRLRATHQGTSRAFDLGDVDERPVLELRDGATVGLLEAELARVLPAGAWYAVNHAQGGVWALQLHLEGRGPPRVHLARSR